MKLNDNALMAILIVSLFVGMPLGIAAIVLADSMYYECGRIDE